jgi:hypothetical protein
VNTIYDLLFCDHLEGFRGHLAAEPADWRALLFDPAPDPAQIVELANDSAAESRVRALAFNRLRALGREAPKGLVLGVVIEIPLDQGLDVLAAYADGRIRYINQTGKMALIEADGLPEANQGAKRLIELAQPVVAGPGRGTRRGCPRQSDRMFASPSLCRTASILGKGRSSSCSATRSPARSFSRLRLCWSSSSTRPWRPKAGPDVPNGA